jgi:outer membrane scaffolding protein for murein synthesis (MipA/OmpV family)
MYQVVVLALVAACSVAHAQTPATNPMPDGSRDMYAGLGVQGAPRYEGAADRRTTPLPMRQVQWGNGIFISGMSMGLHLSDSPAVELGPLLALAAGVMFVNRSCNMAYFGVTYEEADFQQINPMYEPGGGVADVRVGARWNWTLSPAWMVATGAQASRLLGAARRSPLVERSAGQAASSAPVYRF